MRVLSLAIVLAMHQETSFGFVPAAAPSGLITGGARGCGVGWGGPISARSRAANTSRLRCRQGETSRATGGETDPAERASAEGANEKPAAAAAAAAAAATATAAAAAGGLDVEGFMSSLKSSDLLGGDGGGENDGGEGVGELAAAAGDALADINEPGKLVREAAKPFRDDMDRIEADFQRSMAEKEEEMERKLEEMLKRIDGNN